MDMGGGGGGGGYTGGGGGGSTYCNGTDRSGAGGGGGGAGWSSSTATTVSSGVSTGTSTSCSGTGTSNGEGGTGATTAAAGDVGCAGEVSSANFTGVVPGTPTESGSLSYTVGTAQSTATYTATGASSCDGTATYCEFTLASGALPTGLTLNTSTGVISGTPSGTAGNYTFTVTATNPYGTGSATATQTLVLAAGGATKLAFSTTPGTTANGVTFSAQPVVEVQNASGTVVTSSSASVTLSIASGTGTLNCTTNPVTAVSGIATFAGCEITGTAGNFTLSATSTGLTTATSGSFSLTGTLKLAFTTTPGTTNNGVAFSAQPVVKIENSSSVVVTTASAPITLAIGSTNAGGTLACTTNPVTATAGVATFAGCAITGTAGNYNLSATSTGLTTGTSTTFAISAGTATQLVFTTSPGNSTNGLAFGAQPVVKVEDASGNVVASSSASVTLSIASGTGTLNCTTNPVTASSGVATFAGCEITGTAGSGFTLSAVSTGLTTATSGSFSITGTLHLVFTTTPGTTNNGVAFASQPVVKIENSSNAVVTTASAPITLAIGTNPGGTLACTTNPVTATSGVATFAGCGITGTAGTYTLSAASTGLTSGTSGNITINAGTATQLAITTEPSSTANSGAALGTQPVVKVEDSSGNVVTSVNTGSASASIASGSGGSIAAGGTSGTFSSGVATFSGLALNGVNANVYTLTFTGDAFTTVASTNITMSTGAATQLVITTEPSPTDASGAALATQPVVQVEDSGGNVVTTNSSTVTANFTSGGVSLTNPTKAAASGVATFSGLALNALAGNYTLTFSDGGLTTAVSNTITVSTGTATQLVITTEPSSTANAGRSPRHPARGQGRGLRRQRGHLGQHGQRQRVHRLGLRRLHRRGRHLGHLLVGRGHLLGPGPQRRERQRLHPHLHR